MNETDGIVVQYLRRAQSFKRDAHEILQLHDSSPSRLVSLEQTYKKLSGLSLNQDELFKQALRCVENQLFRAAHVMAWAALMDFLEEKMATDGLVKLRAVRAGWKASNLDEIRENYPEYQIIEAARDLGLCTKSQMKALHGLLNKRNECAHPTDYWPDLNQTLGYLSEALNRIEAIRPKTL